MKHLLTAIAALCLAACAQATPPAPQTSATGTLPAPIAALAQAGIEIEGSLRAPAGYRGYLGMSGGRMLPVYLLPDGTHVAVGVLYDASGHDLTTPELGKVSRATMGKAVWKQLERADWIAQGATRPKRIVYEFIDTECPFCHKLWEAEQPLLQGGDVQVRHIVVAVISPKSLPRAAAILSAADPAAALKAHENAFGNSPYPATGTVPAAMQARIETNNQLMQALGITGTPGVVYQDANGVVQLRVGMQDAPTLRKIYGD